VKLDERGNNVLNRIVNNSKRMAELIDDLLRLSRLTRAELQPQTVSISQIAQELARDLQQTDSMRQAEFEIADDLTAQADPSLLRVVLENLLGNAWKYSRYQELTKIVIDQQREGNKVVFRIQDNGAGFDMAHAEFLFAPFRRLHTAEQFPGTGIGLATVQRIIQRHGGKIWATAAPNQGACFYFTLPPFV
jgi:signal transduction histidine kinase